MNSIVALLKKVRICIVGLFFIPLNVEGQEQRVSDSLAAIYLENTATGTAKLELLKELSFNETKNLPLALKYADELIRLAKQEANHTYLFHGYFQRGNKKMLSGDYAPALDAYLNSARFAEQMTATDHLASAYAAIADIHNQSGDFDNAMLYYRKAIPILKSFPHNIALASAILNAGEAFRKTKYYDSALLYFQEARVIFEEKNHEIGKAYAIGNTGMVYASTGRKALATRDINEAIGMLEAASLFHPICDYLLSICDIYRGDGDISTAMDYASRSVQLAEQYQLKEQLSSGNLKLSELYEEMGEPREAFNHYKTHILYRDSLENKEAYRKMADLTRKYELSQKQDEVDRLNRQKKWQWILLAAALIILVVIIILLASLFKNNRQKQKAFTLLSREKAITDEQREQTNKALERLKRTQAHLIQTAKMASLGELTAGIAHEIQNPLNFVNNFSELNTELLTELQEENEKGNNNAVSTIAGEIFRNEEKINYHGKRADSIVKGMLQHSRTGAPERKLTGINALADEYFRLAYHGVRAKDKSFNVAMHTDFDPAIAEVNIVPQEIGRVILNLVNNAFYAVADRAGTSGPDFHPTVTVSTRKAAGDVLISVKDNGIGIPPAVKEKMFQPFFTTKGPGVGTGLGLSLSYDIVKAHGGEIKVESSEDVGTEITVVLPQDQADG